LLTYGFVIHITLVKANKEKKLDKDKARHKTGKKNKVKHIASSEINNQPLI